MRTVLLLPAARVGIAYGVLLILFLRDSRRGTDEDNAAAHAHVSMASAASYLSRRFSFAVLLTTFCLFSLANWAIYAWLPTYRGKQIDLGQGAAGMSATLYLNIASFAGILIGGIWADFWCRTNLRARIYVPLIGFLVAGPALLTTASTHLLALAIGCLIAFGMAKGFADANIMPILCQVVDKRYRASGYGMMNFAGCIVGGLMTYAGGAINDSKIGLNIVFQCASVIVVIAVLLMLLIKPRKELDET